MRKYRGYEFKVTVDLNVSAERNLNGKVLHKIRTICSTEDNYYDKKNDIETSQIEEYVKKHIQIGADYIDNLIDNQQSAEEMLLFKLGFTENE